VASPKFVVLGEGIPGSARTTRKRDTGGHTGAMTDSQGTGSSDSQPVKWALEQARRDLVDLSRRNRLLHAPLGGKRPWCMAIVGHSPDELFDKLYRQENFRGYAFSARDGDDSDEDQTQSSALALQSSTLQPSASIRRPRLQTRLPPDKLERRLTKIFREERTLEEEQGLNTLFLALGFLKWFDSDQAEESFAPLVLVPVTMIRVSGGGGRILASRKGRRNRRKYLTSRETKDQFWNPAPRHS